MKVLWIATLPRAIAESVLDPGLAQTFTHAASWIEAHLPPPEDIDLHIACQIPGGSEARTLEHAGATWYLIPGPSKGRALTLFFFDTQRFRSVFEKVNPDVVHGWGTDDCHGLVARKLLPDRSVVGIQGSPNISHAHGKSQVLRTRMTRYSERLTLKRARCVVAESRFAAGALQPFVPRTTVEVVEQAIREKFIQVPVDAHENTKIVFVGSLQSSKGILDAVEAFSRAAPDPWTLDVYGEGSATIKGRVREIADAAGCGDRVTLRGFADGDKLAEVLADASVFLLPTRVDTGPNALKEGLCVGLWPVCFDNSGPGDYIRRFNYGSLAADRDVGDLSAKLSEALRDRPWLKDHRREKLIAEARDYFSRHRAWINLRRVYGELQDGGSNSKVGAR